MTFKTLRHLPLAVFTVLSIFAATLFTNDATQASANTASFDGNCLPAPVLPDVSVTDPGKAVVRVSSEAELQSAIGNLSPNTVILLAPGTYNLTNTLYIQQNNITLRGDSNRCDAVVLQGLGMDNAAGGNAVPHGVWTDQLNTKIQNLTIRDVYFNSVHINGGAQAPEIYNVALINAGTQFVKSNPIGFGNGVDNGVVNYVAISYTNGTPRTDHGPGTGYVQAVDVHAGDGWVIKNNRIEDLNTPDGSDFLSPPAVLMWNGASNTTVEANVFVNTSRAIAFGLDANRPEDHSGGIIRNNMVVMTPGLNSTQRTAQSDAAIIIWNSPGTKVLHNSVAVEGNVPKSIELRFNTTGVEVQNNLVDAPITHRDNVAFAQSGNVVVPNNSIYRNLPIGDLHLVDRGDGGLVNIADAGQYHEYAGYDFDGNFRGANQDGVDIGADEATSLVSRPAEEAPVSAPTTQPAPTPAPAPAPAANSGQLVTENDLSYEGSFRVPYGDGTTESTLAWGGAGLGYNPANDSLFITGHSHHQLTAEITVPALGQSSTPANLPQASFIQRPEDGTDGKLPTIAEPNEFSFGRIGGYLVDGDDLIISGYHFYDAADQQVRSHLLTDTSLGGASDFVSLTDEVQPRWLGGAMTHIPTEWQDDFGGNTFIGGLSGISIASNSSVGPSAATFTRDSLLGSDPAELVLGYPLSQPLAAPETQNDVWNLTSETRGIVFPEGTSSVLYFGTHGIGEYCYGTGADCGDPVRPYQGTHAYPYRYQVWAYNAADLATVYSGDASPESPQPYDVWGLTLPFAPTTTDLGGTTYDPATGRIFISQGFADGDNPVIHVYTVG